MRDGGRIRYSGILKIGGINVFGGGLALYDAGHNLGAIGVSGDTFCADHFIAWRARRNLGLDHLGNVIGGVSGDTDRPDNIIFDITQSQWGSGNSARGFGHPTCINTGIPANLQKVRG